MLQVNFFLFVAEEVRQGLAALGLRSLDDLTGRADLLQQKPEPLAKTANLDLSFLTQFAGPVRPTAERMRQPVHENGPVLDDEILADPDVQEAIQNEGEVHRSYDILNVDRAALGRVGGAIARLHGDSGFAGTVSIDLKVTLFEKKKGNREYERNEGVTLFQHLICRTSCACSSGCLYSLTSVSSAAVSDPVRCELSGGLSSSSMAAL